MHNACISWCSVGKILSFGEELPVVTSNSSAWYPYLSAVYEDSAVDLPTSLQTFGVFMLPADPHPRVPFDTVCAAGSVERRPAGCNAWLSAARPAVPLATTAFQAMLYNRSLQQAHKVVMLHNRSLKTAPWPWTPAQALAANLTPFSPYGHVLANGDVASLLDLPPCGLRGRRFC